MTKKRKIFCFNNGGTPGMIHARALSEDGYFLAGHLCSGDWFVAHDLGITSDWKHEFYDAHYGQGNWELVLVPSGQVEARSHPGLEAAYAKHLGLTKDDFDRNDHRMYEALRPRPPIEENLKPRGRSADE